MVTLTPKLKMKKSATFFQGLRDSYKGVSILSILVSVGVFLVLIQFCMFWNYIYAWKKNNRKISLSLYICLDYSALTATKLHS